MKDRRSFWGIGAFAAMMILILDGKTAIDGAYDGTLLCIRTVIPSLFPFFVLSGLMNGAYMGKRMGWLGPLGKICAVPEGMESILIPSFLGGYPVAAQTIAQGWRQGQIPKEEAQRLLSFCNNPGPSFIFGMTASLFPGSWNAWMLWGIQILSGLTVSVLIPANTSYHGKIPEKGVSIAEAMQCAIRSMATVCGWVVFFRVIIGFLSRWILWMVPKEVQAVLIGMLELSNGCIALFQIQDLKVRFVLCSGMLTFGGVCVMMQISSVTKGLSLKLFWKGKCLQTLLSLALAGMAAYSKHWIIIVIPVFFMLLAVKFRNKGSIPERAGV